MKGSLTGQFLVDELKASKKRQLSQQLFDKISHQKTKNTKANGATTRINGKSDGAKGYRFCIYSKIKFENIGGEAQRIKIVEEHSKKDTSRTIHMHDKPKTGLN